MSKSFVISANEITDFHYRDSANKLWPTTCTSRVRPSQVGKPATAIPDITSLIALSELYQLSLDNLLKGDARTQAVFKQRDMVLRRARHIGWLLLIIDALLVFGCIDFIQDWHDFAITDTWAILVVLVMFLASAMLLYPSSIRWYLLQLHMPRWVLAMGAIALAAGAGFGAMSTHYHWPWLATGLFSVGGCVLAFLYIRYRSKRSK